VALRDKIAPKTKIIGNGDVTSREHAYQLIKESGADGAMIGRGIFGNPWFFSGHVPTTTEKLNVLVEHTKLFDELLGKNKNFAIMKKHFKAYVNGWDGAKELRVQLMETNTPEEVEKIIKAYIL
jgi:tRNA-dihydrouridine synthase